MFILEVAEKDDEFDFESMVNDCIVYLIYKLKGTKNPLLCIPKHLRPSVLEKSHDEKYCKHLGFKRTWVRVASRFFWTDMLHYTKKYVETCVECQTRNVMAKPAAGPLQSFCPETSWEIMSADFIGPLHGPRKPMITS